MCVLGQDYKLKIPEILKVQKQIEKFSLFEF